MVLQCVQVVFILRHCVAIDEASSRLGILLEVLLFSYLYASRDRSLET
jgi:hypothetical protein